MKIPYLPYRHNFLTRIEDLQNILVVVAMESEEKAILNGYTTDEAVYGKSTKIKVKHLRLNRGTITVARSGVGLVNAGILLSQIVEHQKVDAVLLLGVGGAIDHKLKRGDTVVSKQIIQYDSVSSLAKSPLLIAPGELTLSLPLDQQIDPIMRCDAVLTRWLFAAMGKTQKGSVFEGTILSGSEFVASPVRKNELRKLAEDALLVDMEAAALAQVSRRLQIPFVAAKTVADTANPESGISEDYITALEAAAAHGATLLQALLQSFG